METPRTVSAPRGPEHSQPGKPARSWKVPIIIAAVIVVVLLVVGGLWVFNTQKATTPATDDGPASAVGIAAGSGGTAKASDKRTKIGYEPSCTGAVQAASNYETTVNLYKPASDQAFIKLTNEVFVSPQAAEPFLKYSAKWANESQLREPQQEWGGAYKVESCTPGQSASVMIYSCFIGYLDLSKVAGSGYTDCAPVRVSLQWVGDDWKLASLGMPETESFSGMPKIFSTLDGVNASPPGVTAEQWTKLTAPDDDGPITGWVDFTNAPR